MDQAISVGSPERPPKENLSTQVDSFDPAADIDSTVV